MQKSSLYILLAGASMGVISSIYFLSLIVQLPFIVTCCLVIIALFFLGKWFNRLSYDRDTTQSKTQLVILLIGCLVLADKSLQLAQKHGVWDAWAIWNMHAKYLQDATQWKNLFLNTRHAHADYPLLLPATLAFINKLFAGTQNLLVAFAFHFTITLCIPVLIFIESYKRSMLLVALTLLFFVTDESYIQLGAYQLADTLLGFFLLAACVAINNVEADKRYIALCTAMLGCCIWTKNEGILLALIFAALYAKTLFSRQYIWYSIGGIVLALASLLILKLGYAPTNDIISGQGSNTRQKLTDIDRYKLVLTTFKEYINLYYYIPACAVGLVTLISIVKRKWLPKQVTLVWLACIAYLLIYVVTPQDLEWHMQTSMQRLLHQLLPVAMYATLIYFSGGSIFRFRATVLKGH